MNQLQTEPITACSCLLASRKKTIAFAESATAGALMAAFACTEHSGEILKGGIVCYDAAVKIQMLQVSPQLIKEFSAESIPVTKAITTGLSGLIEADYHIGITGLIKAGGSETADKPVGTIFTCILDKDDLLLDKTIFQGNESEILDQTLEHLCMLLIDKLSAEHL